MGCGVGNSVGSGGSGVGEGVGVEVELREGAGEGVNGPYNLPPGFEEFAPATCPVEGKLFGTSFGLLLVKSRELMGLDEAEGDLAIETKEYPTSYNQ